MNSSKLSAFCDRVLEIGWLLAVVVSPLFFNVNSNNVFERDKWTTLRSIAVAMAAFWLARLVEEWASGRRGLRITWRTPLVLPALFTVLSFLISTVFSVTPHASVFGGYQRMRGTFSTLSCVVIGLIAMDRMRTRAQMDRFVTVVILNSLPIALYGFLQHSGLDPLPWGGDVTRRIASNMGNPIFVAAYMIMAALPTLARVVEAFRAILVDEEAGAADVLRAAAYIFIFLVQIISIWYSKSRGPLMGLLAGLAIWVFLGLLALQRAAQRERLCQPGDLPGDLLRGLGFGVGGLAAAGAVAAGLYFLLKFVAKTEDSTLQWAIPAGVSLLLVLPAVLRFWRAGRRKRPFERSDWAVIGGTVVSLVAVAAIFIVWGRSIVALIKSAPPQWTAVLGAALTFLGLSVVFIANRWGWRWLWAGALLISILFIAAFFVINLVEPVREWSTQQPWLGRLDDVLQAGSGTGMVRNLIWQGALDMILPHDPIEFPPTEAYPEWRPDPVNAVPGIGPYLRLLIGYGPESMYVAYNRFYPPLLGHYEKRTATPDRSHNETMDTLVITGVLGLVAYLWLFGSVFYFGLCWFGFLPSDRRRTLFFVLLIAGAAIATAVVVPVLGPHFFCLAIPVGMVGGLLLYLVVYAFSVYWDREAPTPLHRHFILSAGIFSAMAAHLIEVNFGIAIASTRTTFWVYAGMLVVAGMGLMREREEEIVRSEAQDGKRGKRRRRRRRQAAAQSSVPAWLGTTLGLATVGGFILGTLAFDFITTNPEGLSDPLEIIWRALTVLAFKGGLIRYGVLMVFALTWLMSAVVFMAQVAKRGAFRERKDDWVLATLLYLLVSLALGFGFALILAGRLAALVHTPPTSVDQLVDRVLEPLSAYYGLIVFALVAGGAALVLEARRQPRRTAQPFGIAALVGLAVLGGYTAWATNLKPVQADIVYKQALYFEKKQLEAALQLYSRAIELTPREDFYYFELGRVYLSRTPSSEDPNAPIEGALGAFTQAREINPLNTDHSRGLAKTYQQAAGMAADPETRQTLLHLSSENFDIATTLSPQNVLLWNEWAVLLNYFVEDAAAYERAIEHSLAVDAEFVETWLIQGDVHMARREPEDAVADLARALDLSPGARPASGRPPWHWTYYFGGEQVYYPQALAWYPYGHALSMIGRSEDAIAAFEEALELAPNAPYAWDCHQTLARLYAQTGDTTDMVHHIQMALQLAPDKYQPGVQGLLAQLQPPPEGAQP